MSGFFAPLDPSSPGEDHPYHPRMGLKYPSQWSPAYPVGKSPGRRRPEWFWKQAEIERRLYSRTRPVSGLAARGQQNLEADAETTSANRLGIASIQPRSSAIQEASAAAVSQDIDFLCF